MTSIEFLTLDRSDAPTGDSFPATAFGLHDLVRVGTSTGPSSGFRGFTLSLVVANPATAQAFATAALDAGASVLEPVTKSFWGYGGVVQAPDGTIWKIATSAKKDGGPATGTIDQLVLLLGVADLGASKRFYVEHGLTVAKSYGRKYVEFEAGSGPITLALYGRKALAKDAGVSPVGSGSHRLTIATDGEPVTDPDGFAWHGAPRRAVAG